jgi:hypothetical protein
MRIYSHDVSNNHQQINSDKLQGFIRNPFAFYFPIQRGFSGTIQTLPTAHSSKQRGALCSIGGFLSVPLVGTSWEKEISSVESVDGKEVLQLSKVGMNRVVHIQVHMEKMSMCQRIPDRWKNALDVKKLLGHRKIGNAKIRKITGLQEFYGLCLDC